MREDEKGAQQLATANSACALQVRERKKGATLSLPRVMSDCLAAAQSGQKGVAG